MFKGTIYGARPGDREVEFQIARAVHHLHRDPVALRHAVLPERAREAAHPRTKLGPCELPLALENGDALRIELKRPPQAKRDVHAFLPAALWALAVVAVGKFHTACRPKAAPADEIFAVPHYMMRARGAEGRACVPLPRPLS
jgi:hypothetical protein